MNFRDMDVNEIIKNKYECSCNLVHDPGLEKVVISNTGMKECIDYVLAKTKGKIMVIFDQNIYEIAGKEIYESLKQKNEQTCCYMIPEKNGLSVVPDQNTIGEMFLNMPLGIDLFVSVGSGVVNDLTRSMAYHFEKEYICFATAPSMDGYASVTSALIINNIKESCPGVVPSAIFADIDILKNAPYEMLTAGFGDVLAKYNAVREWQLGRDINGEHYCEEIAGLIWNSADKCKKSAAALKERREEAVKNVIDALVMSGIAMGMYTNTRPGSGAEHHIVHYWDIEFIKRNMEHPLHGNSVGVALCVICRLYDMVKDKLDVKVMDIDTNDIEQTLLSAACEISPKDLGIPKDIFHDSILYGYIMSKTKYTVLTHLNKYNKPLLEQCAAALTRFYYS